VAKRRKVGNLLGLQVLAALLERPMHPYEMATVLRERGKEHDLRINWGSLYTVVQNLEKHEYVEAVETAREGRRPERTTYRITGAGRAEVLDWMRELVGIPEREYPRLRTALSVLGVLPPDQAIGLLRQRLGILDAENAGDEAALKRMTQEIPRLFVVEAEYYLAIRKAEADWLRGLIDELAAGSLDGIDMWRGFHASGQFAVGEEG
jgi:DNA-binding PadR family transcriptional regulator